MAKKKSNAGSKGKGKGKGALDATSMDPKELKRRVDRAIGLIVQLRDILGGLVTYDDVQRVHSPGRFRDGESVAIANVLDAADAHPELFLAIANQDHGTDDARFETQPTRDALARREQMARVADALVPLSTSVSDTVLALGADVRDVSVPAYGVARAAAEWNSQFRSKIATATSFYGGISRKAARTRKQKSKDAGATAKG